GVKHSGAGHDRVDPRLSGRFGVAVGQITSALLVPGMDEAQLGTAAKESVVEVIHVRAGDTENRIHPVRDQRTSDLLAGRFVLNHFRCSSVYGMLEQWARRAAKGIPPMIGQRARAA